LEKTYAYSPCGETEEGYTQEGTPFLYQDDYLDPSTSLYHMQARWYDPQSSLFSSPDPQMGEAQDPSLRYPYAYCAGDPIGNSDPTGMYYDPSIIEGIKNNPEADYIINVLGYDTVASYYISMYGIENVAKRNFPRLDMRARARSQQAAAPPEVPKDEKLFGLLALLDPANRSYLLDLKDERSETEDNNAYGLTDEEETNFKKWFENNFDYPQERKEQAQDVARMMYISYLELAGSDLAHEITQKSGNSLLGGIIAGITVFAAPFTGGWSLAASVPALAYSYGESYQSWKALKTAHDFGLISDRQYYSRSFLSCSSYFPVIGIFSNTMNYLWDLCQGRDKNVPRTAV
jgi:RHS repeat-associated protein